jgi:hypothetical protein
VGLGEDEETNTYDLPGKLNGDESSYTSKDGTEIKVDGVISDVTGSRLGGNDVAIYDGTTGDWFRPSVGQTIVLAGKTPTPEISGQQAIPKGAYVYSVIDGKDYLVNVDDPTKKYRASDRREGPWTAAEMGAGGIIYDKLTGRN